MMRWSPWDGFRLPVAKQFFELIDDHQQIDALFQSRLLEDVDQSQLAHAQRGFDDFGQRQALHRILAKQHAVLPQGASHRAYRIIAGTELGHAPRCAGAGHQALAKRRPQAAVHERGLAAAGRSDDGEKVRVGQLVDHGVDLALPAEEQILLVLTEWPQARKRVRPHEGSRIVHAAGAVAACCRNFVSPGSARRSNPSIRPGSSMSIMSCLSSVRGSAR